VLAARANCQHSTTLLSMAEVDFNPGERLPMTPKRALTIACLVCEYEAVTTDNSIWKNELIEVVQELKKLRG